MCECYSNFFRCFFDNTKVSSPLTKSQYSQSIYKPSAYKIKRKRAVTSNEVNLLAARSFKISKLFKDESETF